MMTSPRLKDGPIERAADPLATEAELDRMLELALRRGAHAVAVGRGRSGPVGHDRPDARLGPDDPPAAVVDLLAA